jgi:hypothetical protein
MGCVPSVADLVHQLRAFHGYRTVWIEPTGLIMHAEPDEELDDLGYRYVATFLRPGPEALAEALLRAGVVLTSPASADASDGGWVGVVEAVTA